MSKFWWADAERVVENFRMGHPMFPAIEYGQPCDFEQDYAIHEQMMAIAEGWAERPKP